MEHPLQKPCRLGEPSVAAVGYVLLLADRRARTETHAVHAAAVNMQLIGDLFTRECRSKDNSFR